MNARRILAATDIAAHMACSRKRKAIATKLLVAPERVSMLTILRGERNEFSHNRDPEASSELLVSGYSGSTKRMVAAHAFRNEPGSTTLEIRFSDWPALRRKSL